LAELCEHEGRDVAALTISANVRPMVASPGAVAEEVAAYAEAGAEVVCLVLPRPYDPRMLEREAVALEPLVTR
jgi:alkanesulfonate monooxygenase SsuD/methylene tetrahydromethanopterin reductase-like flavin-dependent oxidoreductase (luciferase family)